MLFWLEFVRPGFGGLGLFLKIEVIGVCIESKIPTAEYELHEAPPRMNS